VESDPFIPIVKGLLLMRNNERTLIISNLTAEINFLWSYFTSLIVHLLAAECIELPHKRSSYVLSCIVLFKFSDL
jgi:hypothetical protein